MKVKVFTIAYIHDSTKAKPSPEEVVMALEYSKPDELLAMWKYAVEKIARQIHPDAQYKLWYTWGHKTNITVGGAHAGIWYVHSRRETCLIDAWFEFDDLPLNLMFKLAWDGSPAEPE